MPQFLTVQVNYDMWIPPRNSHLCDDAPHAVAASSDGARR
jgi:hypothetical protein